MPSTRLWLSASVCALLLAGGVFFGCAKDSKSSLAPPLATTEEERQGDAMLQMGDARKAVAAYEKALQAGASPASVAWRLGNAFFTIKSWRNALMAFQKATEVDPSMALAWEGAGISAFELGRFDDAIHFLEKAVALDAANWAPHAFLAVIYQVKGKLDLAGTENQKAFSLSGDNKALADATIKQAYQKALKTKGQGDDASRSSTPTLDKLTEKNLADEDGKTIILSAKDHKPVRMEDLNATSGQAASAAAAKGQAPKDRGALKPGPAQEISGNATEINYSESKDSQATATASGADKAPDPNRAETEQTKGAGPAKAKAPEQKDGGAVYTILESSFKLESEAKNRVKALEKKGVAARYAGVDLGAKGYWWRVLIGSRKSMDEVRKIRAELVEKYGLSGMFILRLPQD